MAGIGTVGAAAALYGTLVRPRLMRWGASEEEVTGPYPGASLGLEGKRGATMAVTIDAPPDRVWPWLLHGDRGQRDVALLSEATTPSRDTVSGFGGLVQLHQRSSL